VLGSLAVGTFGRSWVMFLSRVGCRTRNLPLYQAPLGTLVNLAGTSPLVAAMSICILAGALITN
jgi:hypothetical protein